jgi:uncharacterized protein (TIGR00369 family)
VTGRRREGPFWDMVEGRRPPPPVARLLGWTLDSMDEERGTIRVEFTATADFLNPIGTVQGGILAAMLDDTMGPAAVILLGGSGFPQTLELKTSFVRPAYPGKLYAEASVRHRGRDILFLEGSLFTADGELVATATATARVRPFQGERIPAPPTEEGER